MKALGLVFSAREYGNCYDCVEYTLNKLNTNNIETELVNIYDYNIEPCSHCNYECFSQSIRETDETCPKKDDLPDIYKKIEESEIIIFGLPAYNVHVPAIFRAFEERSLGLYGYGAHSDVLRDKMYGFIGLSYNSVIDEAKQKYAILGKAKWIHINPEEYSIWPLKKGIIEVPDVQNRLNQFTTSLTK